MEFIFIAVAIFFAVKVAQSWDRYAVHQAQREYDAVMRRIERMNA